MDRLDQGYLTDLVIKARRGDSNAFAELYCATYRGQYAYCCSILRDADLARQVLLEAYVHALHNGANLSTPGLFLPWLARIVYRCSMHALSVSGETTRGGEQTVATPAGAYPLAHLMQLPLAESQVLLMRYGQGISTAEIGDLLNFSGGFVRRCLRAGMKHLRRDAASADEAEPVSSRSPASVLIGAPKLSAAEAAELLECVFEQCGREPNTVPLEVLSSYAVYRQERFSLQRGVLAALLAVFLLLPILFIPPSYEVTVEEAGVRGLPVYTIRVSTVLPVNRVTAKLRTHSLPVYEAGARLYTVEPTRNGELTVTVELINRQQRSDVREVTAVDAEGPKLTGSDIGADTVLLLVSDAGIGVDYDEIYAVGASGAIYRPLSVDENEGEVLFAYPEEDWDVYIPDHIGNALHLALTLE